MNTPTLSPRVDIQSAEEALRELLANDFRSEAKEDAGSLDRILIHLANIQTSIESTPACLPNAAKRLNDFATMTTRMATRNPQAKDPLTKLTVALQTAGARVKELANAGAENQRADAA